MVSPQFPIKDQGPFTNHQKNASCLSACPAPLNVNSRWTHDQRQRWLLFAARLKYAQLPQDGNNVKDGWIYYLTGLPWAFLYIFFLLSLIWQSLFLYYTSCLRLLQEIFLSNFLLLSSILCWWTFKLLKISCLIIFDLWKKKRKNSVLWTFYGRFCACTILSMKVSKCAKFEEGTWVKTAMSEMWCLLYYVYLN